MSLDRHDPEERENNVLNQKKSSQMDEFMSEQEIHSTESVKHGDELDDEVPTVQVAAVSKTDLPGKSGVTANGSHDSFASVDISKQDEEDKEQNRSTPVTPPHLSLPTFGSNDEHNPKRGQDTPAPAGPIDHTKSPQRVPPTPFLRGQGSVQNEKGKGFQSFTPVPPTPLLAANELNQDGKSSAQNGDAQRSQEVGLNGHSNGNSRAGNGHHSEKTSNYQPLLSDRDGKASTVMPTPPLRSNNVILPDREHSDQYSNKKNGQDRQPTDGLVPLTDDDDDEITRRLSPNGAPRRRTGALQDTLSRMAALVIPRPRTQAVDPLRAQRHRKLLMRHMARKRMRQARVGEQHASNRLWITLGSIGMTILVLFVSLVGIGSFVAYQFYNDTQGKYVQQVASLHDLIPKDNLKMYDSKGVMIMQLIGEGVHTSVPLEKVSQDLINATVATEDKDFWNNQGVDILRIIQAAIDNLRHGRVVEGGSTITQQLIKNFVLQNTDQTTLRKLEEIVLTPELNKRYTKKDIMWMYVNSIFYGHNAYGIDAAAQTYFGLEDKPDKPASSQLDLAQSAMLAGLPNAPSLYDPFKDRQAAINRVQVVLELMVSQHYITKVQAMEAMDEVQKPDFFKTQPALSVNRAPHFANFIVSQLMQEYKLSRKELSRSDMVVYTTLDIALQDKIQKIAQDHVKELYDNGHNASNSAEVLIDPHTGAIISLLGSIDYNSKSIDGQYDVATQGYRQPGSSFKPYVYLTAFMQGASPAQAIYDEPLRIDLPGNNPPYYEPKNYDLGYHGHMTLRCALQNSLNIPAVKTLQHVGIDNAMKTAKEMGIESYSGTPGYSLVLGGLGVHLLDHTSGYGTFANNGMRVPYYGVEKITWATSQKTVVHQKAQGKQVISPQLAYMMTNVLSDNPTRIPEFLDCNVLQLYSNSQSSCYGGDRGAVRPAAAKTGTTNDFRDNWTVGYTTDYVMGVWVGNNDNSPMNNVTGVDGAAPIWHDSMLAAEQNHPIRDFQNPGGLVQATVTYPDGVRSTDWFIPGTVPNFTAPSSQPTPAVTGTPTSTPSKTGPVSTRPYCPNNFNFAFPPSGSRNNGWW